MFVLSAKLCNRKVRLGPQREELETKWDAERFVMTFVDSSPKLIDAIVSIECPLVCDSRPSSIDMSFGT
jgi:hypothetical protein